MFVKCFQPAFGTREKGERRHDGEGRAEMQKREPSADEAHVVIEGQPTDANIFGSELKGFTDGAHVGEQIGVRKGDAFWIAG